MFRQNLLPRRETGTAAYCGFPTLSLKNPLRSGSNVNNILWIDVVNIYMIANEMVIKYKYNKYVKS